MSTWVRRCQNLGVGGFLGKYSQPKLVAVKVATAGELLSERLATATAAQATAETKEAHPPSNPKEESMPDGLRIIIPKAARVWATIHDFQSVSGSCGYSLFGHSPCRPLCLLFTVVAHI